MTIVINTSAPSDGRDYGWLLASVTSWLNRPNLAAQVPDFIRLAEERLSRALRVQQMEAVMAPGVISNGAIAMPADAVAVKTLWIAGFEASPLKAKTYDALLASGNQTVPTAYAQVGSALYFNGAGTVNGVVYGQIPTLSSDAPSNWLLTQYPSAYLFAALVEGTLFTMNDAAAQMWEGRLGKVLDEIAGNDQRDTYSGPLVATAR